ncbi:MAG TPA: hypothetical protein VMH40_16535 [Myxococcaceae bacterium]|nr:hypothetical protein [Myxococcaceae bacterium]
MGFVRTCVWTGAAVGLGIALATVEVEGKTPLARARATWRTSEASDWLRDRADDAVDRAREALGQPTRPRERHTDADRAALDRIIAKRSGH